MIFDNLGAADGFAPLKIGEIVPTIFGEYRFAGVIDGVIQLEPLEEKCPQE